MTKTTMKRRVHAPLDSEPLWKEKTLPERIEYIKALNWYNVERDEKDAAKILKTTPAIAKDFLTLAWAVRLKERGFPVPKASEETVRRMTHEFRKRLAASKPVVADTTNVISIQERVLVKTNEIIGEMQGLIDEYGIRGDSRKLNAYQWMVDNDVKPIHANRIAEFFREQSKEIFEAAQGKDKELSEGYASYGKSRLLNLLHAHSNIITDATKLASNASKQRKPRKRKPVSFDKMVAKIKYKAKDDSLKLQSVDPVRIVGAIQLWVYNSKTRKLGVYNAADESGLKVKGTTILNYVESTSISKTLRKPDKTLPLVVDGGKIALRKVLDGVNAKSQKLNGRINKDTLLLRVV